MASPKPTAAAAGAIRRSSYLTTHLIIAGK
jgi:hypothetical protein